MLAVVVHDVVGRDEGGHIASCLCRQIGVEFPVVLLAACTVDGLVDVLRAAVIGGNHEIPVAEDAIEVAQIAGGSIG